jgi:DNA processing protein
MPCRRRSWLLGNLSALLDYHRGDPAKLGELLSLPGEQLIGALAGSRRGELTRTYRELEAAGIGGLTGGGELCPHTGPWPCRLGGGERMLWLSGSQSRFERLIDGPAVAIIGGPAASPYGVQMAAALARGLAAAGTTIVAGLAGELAQAAHCGALAGGRGPVAVAGDGLDRIRPAGAAALARELSEEGCVVSALPAGASGRGWGAVAAEQAVVALGTIVILVEADASAAATGAARAALAQGRAIGALPGPVTSRHQGGPHELLIEGAWLIRDARDALELLYASHPAIPGQPDSRGPALEPRLRDLLERVGAGEDTAESLTRGAADPGATMAALGELEAGGQLKRLPGGRYLADQRAGRRAR